MAFTSTRNYYLGNVSMEIPQSDSSIQQIFIDYQLHIRNNAKFSNIIVNKIDTVFLHGD